MRGEEVFHCEFARVSTGMGVWIGAKLVVTDPVPLVSPVLISFLLVQRAPFSCFSPKIAHFRIVVSKILTTFPSNLDCISKLLRQYCLTEFNNWNNYSSFNLCFLHFWCIRDKRYSFYVMHLHFIFRYSAPSILKFWYYGVLR